MASPSIIAVDETSEVLNILLHVTYNISAQKYGPRVDAISGALSALVKYGLPVPEAGSEVWALLLRQAHEDPVRVYALGASYVMENVCIGASEHTLKVSLSSLSESQAVEIGPLYLRRLFFLHLGRVEALRRILRAAVEDHSPATSCSGEDRETLHRHWRAARAEILSKDLPQNTSEADMLSTLGPIFSSIVCIQCKEQLQRRVDAVIRDWGRIKRSI
ncbi:hypothetical protein FS837_001530 [Tulasnella sp. UAMH 9824]|nr:hypothetical protein FS837_001530 [Tulasnella sp. UAMH 9824]